MVYTVTNHPINWTSLQESYLEFKLGMLKYEQSMFEMFADMEHNSILNESSLEVIHEGKISNIINKIIEMIKKFGTFIKTQFMKFKEFITKKMSEWSKRTEDVKEKAEISNANNNVQEYQIVDVECVVFNQGGMDKVTKMFDTLEHDYLYPFKRYLKNFDLDMDLSSWKELDTNINDNYYNKFISEISKKMNIHDPSDIEKSIDNKLNLNGKSIKDVVKDYMIMEITIESDDLKKIHEIYNVIKYNKSTSLWIKLIGEYHDRMTELCNEMEDIIKKIQKRNFNDFYNNDNDTASKAEAASTKILSVISKVTSVLISREVELYNASIEFVTYGMNKTNESYIKLIKANPAAA